MPPDRDFIIDALTQHPNILIANGAGHSYKFTSLIGKILSQLATEEKTSYNIHRFRLNRPALNEPNYQPIFRIHQKAITNWS